MNNKYHKYRSKSGRALPGWVKMAAVTLGVGVGSGIGMMPGDGALKMWAGKATKGNAEHTHNTTVNVALQNRCFNFENANVFLPKTLLFILFAVALMYFIRNKSKSDNNGR